MRISAESIKACRAQEIKNQFMSQFGSNMGEYDSVDFDGNEATIYTPTGKAFFEHDGSQWEFIGQKDN